MPGRYTPLDKQLRRLTGAETHGGDPLVVLLDPGGGPGDERVIVRPKGVPKGKSDKTVRISDIWGGGEVSAADLRQVVADLKSKVNISPDFEPGQKGKLCDLLDDIVEVDDLVEGRKEFKEDS